MIRYLGQVFIPERYSDRLIFSFQTDERLVSYSDLLELIVMNKIQRGDFDGKSNLNCSV